ncbi:glycosyltransferase family 2 protein [Bifidobacterium reuteri]|uniref:Glycosyltransferase family 2 protein n=1 Tax=Bifidobacterium reuteri TaxID=983706 RepID=A0A5J5E7U3_9BIFI|nr:glycosyltransferase family 2 protein [Bifidobacterium reuteri]KAA8825260.1 glycosyltransferase family 2 protein [Bifidobacterium reuteri]
MKNDQLVSVIVPVYKVAKYLDRCINSIVKQNYNNLEIILVDDGSPDECPEKCDNWEKEDDRITVIHQSNHGLSSARNTGLDHMHGTYVAFVDSDDYIEKDYVSCMLQEALETNADMVVSSFLQDITDEQGVHEDKRIIDKCCGSPVETYDIVASGFIMAWNKLYRSDLWRNYRFPVGKIHEDELVFHHIFFNCNIVSTVSKPLYHYIYNKSSIMHHTYTIDALSREEAWIDRINYMLKFGCTKKLSNQIGSIFADLDFASTQLDLNAINTKNEIKKLALLLHLTNITNTHHISIGQKIACKLFILSPIKYLVFRKNINHIFHRQVLRP